jgi:hypothetical protein
VNWSWSFTLRAAPSLAIALRFNASKPARE